MNLELGNLLLAGAKSLGTLFLKEIKNNMQNQNITVNAKSKINHARNEIIKEYANIYEVKNGEINLFSKEKERPEFIGITDLKNGFYEMKNGKLNFNEELTNEINEELNTSKNSILEEEREYISSLKVSGEEYTVDEIGDDEKYIFLTRNKTGEEFQEFISDELYNELLNEKDKSNIILVFNGEEYKIKNT